MQRGGRSSGIPVDAARVRSARLAAGLSLRGVAGDDVSRTLIHLIEHGRSRPSQGVLKLIAERTGKPLSYFLLSAHESGEAQSDDSLARQLLGLAHQVARFSSRNLLTKPEQETMKLVELTLRQAAVLTRSVRGKKRR